MGGGGRNRERQNTWDSNAQQQNAQLTQVNPLTQRWQDEQLAFMNWEGSQGRDVRDAPGLSSFIQIGQAAKDRAGRERMGTGALQLGDAGNAGYTENLKGLRQNEAAQDFGIGLENALAARKAEATGSVIPLQQMETQRRMGQAQHSMGMFGQWNQRQSRNWWDYMREGIQMGSQVAQTAGV